MILPSQSESGVDSFRFSLNPARGGNTAGLYVYTDKFKKIKCTDNSGARSIQYYVNGSGTAYNMSMNTEYDMSSMNSFFIAVTSGSGSTIVTFEVYN